ncbi:hypothetical protein EV145_10988 [Flavobacterium sp. 245]|nr:hypothetical protein EV145_10988 [Flavobacterium sp. 245]
MGDVIVVFSALLRIDDVNFVKLIYNIVKFTYSKNLILRNI